MGNNQTSKSRALSSTSIVLYYAIFAAVWIAASDNLLNWFIEDREWLNLLSMGKGFLFVALTSCLLYLLLNLQTPTNIKEGKNAISIHRLYWLFAFQILIMPLIPVLLYAIHGHQLKNDSYSDLTALTKVKTEQIESWLKERITDGIIMQNNQLFIQSLALISYGGSETADAIQKPLQQLQQAKAYQAITFFDLNDKPQLIYGQRPTHKTIIDAPSQIQFDTHWLLASNGAIKTSWYWNNEHHLFLDIQVPLFDMRFNKLIGTLVMTQDLQKTLLPQIKYWNGTTNTGKVYLLQPHSDQLAFIEMPANNVDKTEKSDIKYNQNTAEILKQAITDHAGVFEGKDILQHKVIASYTPLQHSGWHLLVQQDQAEIYAPLYLLVYWISLIVFFSSLVVIFVVSLLWRQQQYTNQLEIQRQTHEKDKLLRHFFELPLFGMAITHTQTGRWIRFNNQLADMLGYSHNEIHDQTLITLTAEEYRAIDAEAVRQMELNFSDGYRCEKQLRRKDGHLIYVNVDTRCVRASNRTISFIITVIEDISQRKASEHHFRTAIMNSPSPTVIYTESGVGLTLNRRWTELSGYDLTDIPCRSEWVKVANPLQPDNPNAFADSHSKITAPVHNGEYLIRCKDGSLRYWDMHSAPLGLNQQGELLLLSMASDITERKIAEEELKKSEGLFHTLATFVPVGIFRLDLIGNLRYLNEFGIALLKCPTDDLSQWLNMLISEDRQQLLDHWLPSLLNGVENEIECRICRDDEPCSWLIINALPEKNTQGETIGYIGSITDITSQKSNEEILRQAATVFDHTREGIMITDTQANILRVNPALTTLFGYKSHELLNKTPAIFRSGQYSTEFYQRMWNTIETFGYWRGEIWNRRKDGELIPLIGSISSVYNDKQELTHYVSVYSDIRQLKDSEAQLEHLARHDPLTQLPNRSLLSINLAHALKVAARQHQRIALLMLDLDRFKDVNDSFGHQIGDVLLQKVALRLRQRIPISDTICRLGGDEFTVLIEGNTDIQDIDHMAEEILRLLATPFHLPNGREVVVGASIGISLYPEHGSTAEDLLQQADAAMYRAKASGRSCFRYFSDELTQAAEHRLDLEIRLRRAIELNQLRVYFQPQMDIATNRIIGAEALVRWQDPERGLITPINFIPVAEETGLIKQLGEWVLFETCRQGQAWLQKGLPAINLAVNISPVQFRYSNIMTSVMTALDETGFPASHLELELTESALMAHETEAAEILNQLRKLGVRLAIDDFGTGYSSLAYLKRFPLDVLKIDKSFVDDIPHKKDDMEIAATIVAMAHTLRLKVMAEGVETTEQLAFLKSQGCDCYQGYLMSPPISAIQFEQLLREQQPV
jgi:diguanylate cyclase (GGDEF)-like protein/PAS domain S-box-containing protein